MVESTMVKSRLFRGWICEGQTPEPWEGARVRDWTTGILDSYHFGDVNVGFLMGTNMQDV
jgi:hypothetical protein